LAIWCESFVGLGWRLGVLRRLWFGMLVGVVCVAGLGWYAQGGQGVAARVGVAPHRGL
jgi:hypothetical protein